MSYLISRADIVDTDGLYAAVQNGNLKIVKNLLKNGADPNRINDSDRTVCMTPLHAAVCSRQVKVAKLLIKYGANVNIKNDSGYIPIVYAILEEDTRMIELLQINGAEMGDPNVLFTAVHIGNLKIVEDLLKDGANPNMINESIMFDAVALLHVAVSGSQMEMVKLLINYEADVNIQDDAGHTPVVHAILKEDTEMTKLLIIHGADMEDPDVLYTAVQMGNLKIVEDLLKDGADPNMINDSDLFDADVAPLHVAVSESQIKMAKLLMNYGANVNIQDDFGHTPIVYAIQKEDTKMIELLLTNGADVGEDKLLRVNSPKIKMLKQHIAKVKAAGLYVSERNLLWISNDDEISNFLNECEAEIQIMKSQKIDDSCTYFYDILTKNTSELAKQGSIVQALKSYDYKTKFPIYASMIDSRFRRGLEREELLEQVRNKFLQSLFESLPELPYLSIEKIISYLSYRDLRIVLDA